MLRWFIQKLVIPVSVAISSSPEHNQVWILLTHPLELVENKGFISVGVSSEYVLDVESSVHWVLSGPKNLPKLHFFFPDTTFKKQSFLKFFKLKIDGFVF